MLLLHKLKLYIVTDCLLLVPVILSTSDLSTPLIPGGVCLPTVRHERQNKTAFSPVTGLLLMRIVSLPFVLRGYYFMGYYCFKLIYILLTHFSSSFTVVVFPLDTNCCVSFFLIDGLGFALTFIY